MQAKLVWVMAGMAVSFAAHAHVKWFSLMANCANTPVTTLEVFSSPLFAGLAIAASAIMFAVVAIDRRLSRDGGPALRCAARLDDEATPLIAPLLRIGVAVYFLSIVIYFHGSPIILTVELKTDAAWVPALQLAIAAAVLVRRGGLLAAAGIVFLFAYSVRRYGAFHMLDYPFFLGLAAFLSIDAVCGRRKQPQGLGILRLTVGVSLLWCGVEKWLYPGWTYELLVSDLRVLLETGLSPALIVMGAGFVEFCLAFILIFGRLASQIAAAVLVLVMTAAIPVVGVIDLIGHLPILLTLVILAGTRNPIGRGMPEPAKRWSSLDPDVSFVVSVPGFVGAYYLMHEAAYGALGRLGWLEALVAGALLALLTLQIVRTAPPMAASVCRLKPGSP
jgi:hypothetical protein